ncbi:hypothetical protein NDU88_002776 [Pleurodeles waltl]|uniref:Uncharacterized protein n=1 Tax=Pleurodeles waltl TaxID=8319 RepID=A0AAV7NEZ1_PLEWA|nr:hypothetical protein NDU88_002776 [Pleurodeles waltl]
MKYPGQGNKEQQFPRASPPGKKTRRLRVQTIASNENLPCVSSACISFKIKRLRVGAGRPCMGSPSYREPQCSWRQQRAFS